MDNERLFVGQGNPHEEPEGFWARLKWWLTRRYEPAERWEHDQTVRRAERGRVLAVLATEFSGTGMANEEDLYLFAKETREVLLNATIAWMRAHDPAERGFTWRDFDGEYRKDLLS